MLVSLDADVFDDSAPLMSVMRIIDCFRVGRHRWLARPETLDAAERYLMDQAPRMAHIYVELGRKSTASAAWAGTPVIDSANVTLANLEGSAEDLGQPAVLVVEDHVNDLCFVGSVLRIFKSDEILSALNRGWLEIRHAGGSRIETVALAERKKFVHHIRVMCLLDSDRMIPHQQTSNHRKAVDLRVEGIRVHVLELREAENYVPNRALAALRPARAIRRKISCLKKLTHEQRGYFDIKKGFAADGRVTLIPEAQAELFRGLSERELRGLQGGFGKEVLAVFEQESIRLSESDFAGLGDVPVRDIKAMISSIQGIV